MGAPECGSDDEEESASGTLDQSTEKHLEDVGGP